MFEQPVQKSRSESKCPSLQQFNKDWWKQQDSKCKKMQDAKKDALTSNDSKAVQF